MQRFEQAKRERLRAGVQLGGTEPVADGLDRGSGTLGPEQPEGGCKLHPRRRPASQSSSALSGVSGKGIRQALPPSDGKERFDRAGSCLCIPPVPSRQQAAYAAQEHSQPAPRKASHCGGSCLGAFCGAPHPLWGHSATGTPRALPDIWPLCTHARGAPAASAGNLPSLLKPSSPFGFGRAAVPTGAKSPLPCPPIRATLGGSKRNCALPSLVAQPIVGGTRAGSTRERWYPNHESVGPAYVFPITPAMNKKDSMHKLEGKEALAQSVCVSLRVPRKPAGFPGMKHDEGEFRMATPTASNCKNEEQTLAALNAATSGNSGQTSVVPKTKRAQGAIKKTITPAQKGPLRCEELPTGQKEGPRGLGKRRRKHKKGR